MFAQLNTNVPHSGQLLLSRY